MHVLNAGELLYCQDSSHKVAGIGDPKMKVHACSFINLRNFNISKFHNLTDTNGQAFFFSAAPASATIAQVAAAAIGAVAAAAVVCSLRTLFHRDFSSLNSKRKKKCSSLPKSSTFGCSFFDRGCHHTTHVFSVGAFLTTRCLHTTFCEISSTLPSRNNVVVSQLANNLLQVFPRHSHA